MWPGGCKQKDHAFQTRLPAINLSGYSINKFNVWYWIIIFHLNSSNFFLIFGSESSVLVAQTSSNQRLGVRSVVPVKIRVCCWTHYLSVNGWSSDMIYWQSPLLFCGLFDFFAVSVVSKRCLTGYRWTAIWWPLVTRCVTVLDSQVNICLWLFMLNISASLLLVMFKHKGQYFKTNTSVTSSILSWKHTYQLTSDNTCNIWTRMSVYPWFFVNKLRAGNNYYFRSDEWK